MRPSFPAYVSERVRGVLRRPYYVYTALVQRVRQRRRWQISRRTPNGALFPALTNYALTTRAYVQKTRPTNSAYLPIADVPTFHRVPPKTIGDNQLAHLSIPYNPPLFVAKIQNARVLGDAGDVVTRDGTLLTDISFRYPTRFIDEPGEHLPLQANPLPPARSLRGTYALLTSLYGGSNYFHWMFNALARLALLERARISHDTLDGFLLNHIELPVITETLDVLNIPRTHLIEMDKQSVFEPASLWVMPSLITTGHRRRFVCDWLRAHFLQSNNAKPQRRFYLSRADAPSRRMTNDAQLFEILEPFGFEKIVIGERPLAEQSALFAQAAVVIAPHSAALTNLVFCSPDTRVLDIMPHDRVRTYYWELSVTIGLDYYYAYSQPDPTPRPDRLQGYDTLFPPDQLRALLQRMKLT